MFALSAIVKPTLLKTRHTYMSRYKARCQYHGANPSYATTAGNREGDRERFTIKASGYVTSQVSCA